MPDSDCSGAGIDANEGQVKISGWIQDSGIDDIQLAQRVVKMGFSAIVYTSIARDGDLSGPDLVRTRAIAQIANIPVIVSGGVSNIQCIDRPCHYSLYRI